jgi:IS30 family transposase
MAKKSYVQLTYEDRLQLSRWNARKMSVSEMARRLGVHKSTVSRELRRNGQIVGMESQLFYLEMSLLGFPKAELRKHLAKLREHALRLADYNAWTATNAQANREHRLRLAQQLRRRKSTETRKWVIGKLKEGWSPEQIAGRSKLEAQESVSYEYVYRLIYEDKKQGGTLQKAKTALWSACVSFGSHHPQPCRHREEA